jgi:hypothetical protein
VGVKFALVCRTQKISMKERGRDRKERERERERERES